MASPTHKATDGGYFINQPIDRRSTCQQLGICKDRYPNCGRCDDDHPEDEPPTPTPMEEIYAWLRIGVCVALAFVAIGALVGYLLHKFTPF